MPIVYKDKQLDRFEKKTGGKNRSDVDGFYETTEGKDNEKQRYFIKKPADKRELFTELFAGLLLREMMARGLIEEEYFPSLICADLVEVGEHSYGLIQPLVAFDELYKVIGTGTNDNRDRSVVKETLFGPAYYAEILKQGKYYGLSMALMFSLLLGAHSVHSGNIVILKEMKTNSKQFGRIDWGDAFRYFAHPSNNDDVLYAYENRGATYKKLTKDYFLNYRNIKGIFPAMAEKAKTLQSKLNEGVFAEVVISALKKIPADFIDAQTQDELSKYMQMDSFKSLRFGPDGDFQAFAMEMAKILMHRLGKISELRDIKATSSNELLYASVIENMPLTLKITPDSTFEQNIVDLQTLLGEMSSKNKTIDSKSVDVVELTGQFNSYVSLLANASAAKGFWGATQKENIFTPYYAKEGQAEYGYAFLKQYTEGTILEHIFCIDLNSLNIPRFAPLEGPIAAYSKYHPESMWVKIQLALSKGQDIINTLHVIKNAQQLGMDEAVAEQLPKLGTLANEFLEAKKNLDTQLPVAIPNDSNLTRSNPFFYPMDEEALVALTGDQLATLCLEELNSSVPSPLIHAILSNEALWNKARLSLESGEFDSRLDTPRAKIHTLFEWQQLLGISEQSKAPLKKENERLQLENAYLNKELVQLTERSEVIKQQTLKLSEASAALRAKNQQTQEEIRQLKEALEQQKRQEEARQSKEALEQQKKQEELRQLKETLEQQKKQSEEQVQQLIQQNLKAEQRFESLLAQGKSVALARQARLAPLILQIQEMETKANDLSNRHESAAAAKALTLALHLRLDMHSYTNNPERDEAIALQQFKNQALGRIDDTTKEVLNTHRKEWKYILGNVGLGLIMLGFGYLAAIFLNKRYKGNYTFFSKTESGEMLDKTQVLIQTVSLNN